MSDANYAAAGDALESMGDNGIEWVITYGLPVAMAAVGIGVIIKLGPAFGKKVAGWLR